MPEIYVQEWDLRDMMFSDRDSSNDSSKREKKDNDEILYDQWIKSGDQYYPSKETCIINKVDPGFYYVAYEQGKYSLVEDELNLDEIYLMPNSVLEQVVEEIDLFWSKKDLFKENSIVHKRGICLVGKPGTGKSSFINLLSKRLIDQGGIIFHISNANELAMFLHFVHVYFREIEPETPIITVIEDIDKLVDQDEHLVLSFLDGEDQVDHNVIIGTSNRLDKLNDLILRPSRFDWVIDLGDPDEVNRRFYFEQKGLKGEELDTWVSKTKGLSMAHLKEVYIAVKLLDNDLEITLKRLNNQDDMIENFAYTPKAKKGIGFKVN